MPRRLAAKIKTKKLLRKKPFYKSDLKYWRLTIPPGAIKNNLTTPEREDRSKILRVLNVFTSKIQTAFLHLFFR